MSNTDDSNKTINKSHVLTISSEDTSLSNEIIGEINFKAPIENTSKNKPHNFTTSSIQVKADESFCINNVGGSWTYDYTGGTSEKLWTTSEPHGLVIGDTIIFNKLGENALGYKPNTIYYVIGTVTETTLRLSLTSGGNAVDNLVVWLKFDNNNTDTQGNTVTETGTLTYLSTSGNYKRGTHSAYFTSGDYLTIANPLQDLSGALTLSLWLYPNSLPTATVCLEKGYANEFELNTISSKIRIHYGATGTYVYYTTTDDVLTVNTWTHIGITRDSSTSAPKIYIDGVLQDHSYYSVSGTAQASRGYHLLHKSESNRTYSSIHNNDSPGTGHARSTIDSSQAWSAATPFNNEWVYLDLGSVKKVDGTVIQGRTTPSTQRVIEYSIEYSNDSSSWTSINSGMSFYYTSSVDTIEYNPFPSPITARYIKFNVIAHVDWISMRCDVYQLGYPIYIGQRRNIGSTVLQYTGYMDDLRIFNESLTHNQIYQIYSETNYIEFDTKNNEKYYAHHALGGEWSYTDITPSQTWTSSLEHNLVQNNTVVFTRVGTGGKGYHANTEYYVKEVPTTTTVKLSLTSGGDVVEGTYNTEKYTSNLVGWWKMDGNVNDSSGNNNHGTNVSNGATLTTNRYGESNKAYNFSNDYITVSQANGTLDMSSNNTLSMSVWVNCSNYASDYRSICYAYGSSTRIAYAIWVEQTSGKPYFQGGGYAVISPYALSLNTWHHIVVTLDGTNVRIYIDGDLKITASQQAPLPALNTSQNFHIGYNESINPDWWSGKLDDLRIYSTTLTERQVKDIYDEPPSVIKWQLTKTSLNAEMIFNTNNSKSTSEKLKIDKDGDSQFTGNITIQDKTEIVSHSDLVGWWKLDGNVNDSSGNSYNGTYNGGTAVYLHNYENVAGKALNFDGTDDYISISSFPSQIPTGSSLFSISVWIKPHVHNGSSCIIGWGVSSDSNSNVLRLEGTTQIRHFFHGSGLGYDIVTTTGDLSNKFTHLVVTYNGTNRIIYMNGTQIDSDTPPTPNVTNQNFVIGRRTDSSTEYFNGHIADIRIYNRTLTSSEVFNIYSPSNLITQGVITGTDKKLPVVHYKFDKDIDYKSVSDSVPTDNLLVWLKFDESSGTTANDSSGNDNHGTLGDGSNSSTYPTLTVTGYDGTVNGAYSFDGTDDYIDLSSHASDLADFSGGFSFTGWIKWDTTSGYSKIFDFGVGTTNNIVFYHDLNTTSLVFNIVDGSGTGSALITSTGYIFLGTWIHVAVTFNNETKKAFIYKNGVLTKDGTLTNSIANVSRTNSYIGKTNFPNPNQPNFDGSMDDFRIYNTVLTSNQILNIVNQPPITIPTPVVWMKFNNKLHDEQNNSVTETSDVTFNTIQKRFGTHSAYFASGDYLKVNNPSQDLSGALTITLWLYPNSLPTATIFLEKGYTDEFELATISSKIRIHYGATGTYVYYTTTDDVLTVNTWTHIGITRDSSTSAPKIYIDGVLQDHSYYSVSGTAQASNSTNPIYIGQRRNIGSTVLQYTGYMDDLRIFNQALSIEQIIEISGFAKGSIIDSSGNGFNGNIKGLLTHLPGYTGNNNGGYRFPGNTSNLITLPSTIQNLVDNQTVARSFTISFWIKFRDTNTSAINYILSFSTADSTNNNLHFFRYTDQKIGFTFFNAGNDCMSTNAIADTSWHHVVGTFTTGGPATNGVKVLYIDGKFEGRNTVGYPNLTGAPNFELGYTTNSFFSLDDFRIYNEALTSNEIMRLYTSYNPKGIKIMDSGNVGIGKNYPDCPLYIKNTSNDINSTTVLVSSGQSLLSMEQNNNIWRMSLDYSNSLIFSSDLGTINKRGYITTSENNGNIIFTGQHRCLINKNIDSSFIGLIVSATNNYVNLDNSVQPTISESLPIVELSNIDNDSRVFGVLSQKENDSIVREHSSGNFVSIIDKANQKEQRFYVNSLGEGGIWICNKNGNLLNGEYVTSSTVNGYGVKQTIDIGLLTNFTVAKITCDCDFSINKIVKQKIKVENNQIEYDTHGDIQFIDDLNSDGNQQLIYPFETRFIDSLGNQLSDESDYITRLNNGEQVYIACFVGCTYHCG